MKIQVDPQWWTDLFDEVYLKTDARSVCDPDITRRELDLFLRLLPIRPHHRILDLCGGHGRHSIELGTRGYHHCSLVDYSHTLIRHALDTAWAKRVPIAALCCDARATGLADASHDHVLILGNSLGYALEDDADDQILGEALRVLRPGGWVLIDIADGHAVRRRFSPNAWHEIEEDLVVCRHRELSGDRVNAREMVLSKQGGLVRDRTYSIRLYDAPALDQLLRRNGFCRINTISDFSPHEQEGDYGFMNHRLLGLGQKPS